MKEKKLEKSFRLLIAWTKYRLKQNTQSLNKLNILLTKLDRSDRENEIYDHDLADLDSLKIIYETSIRDFEAQIDKYEGLINQMQKDL